MDYEVSIDGVKLSAEVKDIQISDRQGSQADDIRLIILNNEKQSVKRGSVLRCSFGGFSSGKMNVDKISSSSTITEIGAISVPLSSKDKHTRHWRKVRLFDIVNDVASNCGLSVYYQGVTNYLYENVTQFRETDLAFLNRLCIREGYSLKIDDNRLVIYNNTIIESGKSVLTINGNGDVVDNRIFFSENPNMIKSVTVKYYGSRLITYTAERSGIGEKKTFIEYLANGAEAERFAKGYLKAFSQNDTTVECVIPINDGVAAGCCVEFKGFAMYDGKYVIFECDHDPEKEQTKLRGRKV